ncbi:hypothetical protein KIN20_032795 [Parelaphostrongylus tenuis]|uniref:NAD(+) kinase n=1 Tax=Parelaphostrongylus tenuis TaxID=148309 RepID=A0AAD5WIA3_PARTN|nr:hypothetical protein KIN20_032795 [Parelaphostrongylus tenuis]
MVKTCYLLAYCLLHSLYDNVILPGCFSRTGKDLLRRISDNVHRVIQGRNNGLLFTCSRSTTNISERSNGSLAHHMRLLSQSLLPALYRNPVALNVSNPRRSYKFGTTMEKSFQTKKDLDEEQLKAELRRRGSDYNQLIRKHQIHHSFLQTIQSDLEEAGVESKVVQRFDYTEDVINWADAVLTAGGDGTFLLGASRIHQRDKPVIGICTDPQGSEGYMCLMRKLPKEHFRSALRRLLDGDFHWLYRQRIRITLSGDSCSGVGDSIYLHDQQLNTDPVTTRWLDSFHQPSTSGTSLDDGAISNKTKKTMRRTRSPPKRVTMQLPVLALNEVFIGESLSSRVSYYEIQIDNGKMTKQKSSGITICTGTGSTSWYFNINKLTEKCVSDLLRITSDHCGVKLPADNKQVVTEICTKFNQQLIFEPDSLRMAFTMRDPIFNSTFSPTAPRGFAEKIRVKSRGYDAHLVVDGGVSYRFNDGAEAFLEVREEDALQTVVFR